MIKIFRKIRQKMLSENKIGKYVLYAIGEIVLVVIGILIALWINTQKHEMAQQKKIDTILVKIQNDLLQDIDNAEWLLENYMRKDSIYNRLMGGNLSNEDIKAMPWKGSRGINFVTEWWMDYHLQNNGYKQLMNIIDVVPEKYDGLIKTLEFNYINRQATFQSYNKNSEDIVRQYKYYLNDNHSWKAIDDYNGEMSDAQAEYIRDNPKFKNQMNALLGSFTAMVWEYKRYRKVLMQTYIMINELLGKNARPLPTDIRTTSLASEKDAGRFIGLYKLTSGNENIFDSDYIEVFNEGKDLFFKAKDNEVFRSLLFLDAKKPLFAEQGGITIWRFDRQGKNTLKRFNGRRGITEWIKVDNE